MYEWLDPRHVLELQEARQVLEGAPQPCSARGQHAQAVHQAVLALDKHTVSVDRVVNIDETSCRLLLVNQIGWGRRGV